MKPKTMILMVIAIVCGLGASYMTSRLLAERGDVKEEEKVAVVVAKKSLLQGTHVKKPIDLFEVKEFPKGKEPKDAFTSLDPLKGKFLKRQLRKDDFVTAKDIEDTQTILDLPKGMVAVGIRVNAESIASGFAATPGSRINIIWTIRGGQNMSSQAATLLQNVLVLAADINAKPNEEKGPMLAQVVTVALSQVDAQEVKLAQQHGDLSFTLQNPEDELRGKVEKVTLEKLLQKVGVKDQNQSQVQAPELPKVAEAPKTAPTPVPQPVPQPEVAPKVVKAVPKFEKHVITVREGKNSFNRVFWFDEQGQPVPDEVVKKYQSEVEAASEVVPPAATPAPNAGNSQPAPAVTAPNASGPQSDRPEGDEKKQQSPPQRADV